MKILHIDTGKNWRGGQAQVDNLIRNLPGEIKNHLLTPLNSELNNRINEYLPKNQLHTHKLRGEWDLTATWYIHKLHKKHNFDLIHAHSSHALGITWITSILFDIPPHIETRRLQTHVAHNWPSQRKYNSALHHIANSQTVKEALIESGILKDKITVVPSGINLSKIDSTSPAPEILKEHEIDPDKFIIGNVGALSPQKDHKLFIEVAAEIVKEFPETQFVIAGEGELRSQLKKKISDLKVQNNVHLLGFVNNIFGLYKCFDLYLATARYEGLCGTLLQAMACRVPIITSNVRGSREILHHGENCRTVEVGNRDGFINELQQVLNNNLDISQYLNPARKTAEKFDYPELAKKTADLYNKLLN